MQDPLKRNKAFKESYLSCQAHKKYLTPYNVETLMTSLQQLREQTVSTSKSSSSTSKKPRSQECSFVDSYLQSALPTVSHKPLITENKPWSKGGRISERLSLGESSTPRCKEGEERGGLLGASLSWEKPSMSTNTGILRPLPSISHESGPAIADRPHSSSGYSSCSRTSTSMHEMRGNTRASLRPDFRKLLEMPRLEPSIIQSLTKPCSDPATWLSGCTWNTESKSSEQTSLSDSQDLSEGEEEEEEEGESDSGWLEDEDDLMSDLGEDGIGIEGSLLSRGTWELESIGGESHETDSGQLLINDHLSPHSERRGICTSAMIPARVCYPGEKEGGVSPALTPSLFPNRQPTIHFPLPKENYEELSSKDKLLLKWKPSTITPNVIKHTLNKVGFTYTSKASEWIGYWGKHMKSEGFKTILPHQKVNHLPGSFQIGRKDRLWRNLSKMQAHFGKRDYDFVPLTFVLPSDTRSLKRTWEGTHRQKWIIKPPASARGIGIQVVHKWSQIPKKRPLIVQKYISDPFLINDSKFDLRIYAYVSCIDPLTIYLYRDGLVRFATKKGLLALWEYMETQLGIDPSLVWKKIQDLVIKTMMSCEGYIASLIKANCRDSSTVHELFGFDIMLDKNLKPWLLEVNVSPSLHSNSQLDYNIKAPMMRDLFNMAGFSLPKSSQFSTTTYRSMTSKERLKHSHYSRLAGRECDRHSILRELTQHDYKILTRFIDENNRRGGFIRIYPTTETIGHYTPYFQYEVKEQRLIY
uniref:Uncharacterized protein n=1 Tax=Amphimedon queenslandica TaxID=400682 RepID=A0A1X7VMI8_AMPQE